MLMMKRRSPGRGIGGIAWSNSVIEEEEISLRTASQYVQLLVQTRYEGSE